MVNATMFGLSLFNSSRRTSGSVSKIEIGAEFTNIVFLSIWSAESLIFRPISLNLFILFAPNIIFSLAPFRNLTKISFSSLIL